MSGPILVWGAGAIGATLGASFLASGERVVFVDADAAHVAAMRRDGLHVTGPIRDERHAVEAFGPHELRGVFERVVLAVKAHHTDEATAALVPHLAADGYVLSAQNGLNERVIARRTGVARVVGCFVNFGADYLEPGTVHYSGQGAVVVGEMDGTIRERTRDLHRLLLAFDERAVLTPNISGYLWGKLIYGGLLFATALTDDSIADVLAAPEHRPVLTALAHEISAVATREGLRLEAFDGFRPDAFLPDAAPDLTARSFDDMVVHNRRSAKSHSGIWRDLAVRKRRTEVDAQLGPVAEIGAGYGIATPITERLIAMIHEIEEGRRPLARENLAELATLRRVAA
ncbi:MAG: 2-dehydropantoate 2-reductase [Methylobacterium sp.]